MNDLSGQQVILRVSCACRSLVPPFAVVNRGFEDRLDAYCPYCNEALRYETRDATDEDIQRFLASQAS